MSYLEFIAELVKALAWPTAVIIILFLFRRQIVALTPTLKKLKYKSFEVEFKESLREARQALQAQARSTNQLAREPEWRLSRLTELANLAPRAAILEAWLEVESEAVKALERRNADVSKADKVFPMRLGDALQRNEVLTAQLRAVYDRLRGVRNKAVHVPEAVFEPDEVADYVYWAMNLAWLLRSA